jgi:glucose/mannose-6-phosphate isomerase
VRLADVLAQPHQIGDALWRIESASIPPRPCPGGVAVCGPGGGAGGLAAAALGDRATAPVRDVRALEPWVRDDTFVLCASYSGDDEEALAGFEEAGARGAPRAVVCTAGRLAVQAREEGVPVIGVPGGMSSPGAAVVYFTLAALECAALAGAGPSLRAEAEVAAPLLERLAADSSTAADLANRLAGRIPVIHGPAAVARRWAEQIEEHAGVPAFQRDSPPPPADPLEPVDLDALAQGDTALARVLSLVLLGDLVAVSLGVHGPPKSPHRPGQSAA